jgi:Tol biopolymer transport system component
MRPHWAVLAAVATALCLASPAAAAPTTTLVNVTSTGGLASAGPDKDLAISGDGHLVVFVSAAANLVPGDSNHASDVFVRDLTAGTTTRVSVATGGAQGNANSTGPVAISRDGRYVLFETWATNLAAGTDGTARDIVMRDTQTGTTKLVKSFGSGPGDFQGGFASLAISSDGAYAAYEDQIGHVIYTVRQTLATGTEKRLNPQHLTFGDVRLLGMSADGSRLLVGSDGGREVRPGFEVTRQGTFLRDLAEGSVTRLLRSTTYVGALSGDGRIAVLTTLARLGRTDHNRRYDVYVRNVAGARYRRVSGGPNGRDANGDSFAAGISDDGRYVLFLSEATNLVRRDTNGAEDAFLRDRRLKTLRRCSRTSTGGQASGSTRAAVLSADGAWVAFLNGGQLVPADVNRRPDVYLRGPGC